MNVSVEIGIGPGVDCREVVTDVRAVLDPVVHPVDGTLSVLAHACCNSCLSTGIRP